MADHHVEIVDVAVAVDSVSVSVVRAVAEAVHPPGVTRADLDELLGVLQGIRDDAADERAERRLAAQAPMFARLDAYVQSPEGLTFIITVVIALLALIPPVIEMVTPDDPSNVTVEVDGPSTEDVERIVEERLRVLTESGEPLPGAVDGPPEDDPPTTE